jgi:hypothetical protein
MFCTFIYPFISQTPSVTFHLHHIVIEINYKANYKAHYIPCYTVDYMNHYMCFESGEFDAGNCCRGV